MTLLQITDSLNKLAHPAVAAQSIFTLSNGLSAAQLLLTGYLIKILTEKIASLKDEMAAQKDTNDRMKSFMDIFQVSKIEEYVTLITKVSDLKIASIQSELDKQVELLDTKGYSDEVVESLKSINQGIAGLKQQAEYQETALKRAALDAIKADNFVRPKTPRGFLDVPEEDIEAARIKVQARINEKIEVYIKSADATGMKKMPFPDNVEGEIMLENEALISEYGYLAVHMAIGKGISGRIRGVY